MLLPCTDNYLRNQTLDRHSYRVGRFDNLSFSIERALTDVLEKEVLTFSCFRKKELPAKDVANALGFR